jgi:hypothetical protein
MRKNRKPLTPNQLARKSKEQLLVKLRVMHEQALESCIEWNFDGNWQSCSNEAEILRQAIQFIEK